MVARARFAAYRDYSSDLKPHVFRRPTNATWKSSLVSACTQPRTEPAGLRPAPGNPELSGSVDPTSRTHVPAQQVLFLGAGRSPAGSVRLGSRLIQVGIFKVLSRTI
jgi:hypothetical protein